MIRAGVIGASGYAGRDAISLLLAHPEVELSLLSAKIDEETPLDGIFGSFKGRCDLPVAERDPREVAEASDVVFLATPHGVSMRLAPAVLDAGAKVIDLSGDYRLSDVDVYTKWYGMDHVDAGNLGRAAYGIPELFREDVKGVELVANPGCYATGAILALAPLARGRLADGPIVVDSKTGASGGGRNPNPVFHYPECNESVMAYKVGRHQHTPEMVEHLSRVGEIGPIVFSPHLVPMDRGILTAAYVRLARPVETAELLATYEEMYGDEQFVCVLPEGQLPVTKHVAGTNYCHVAVTAVGEIAVAMSAIDNLIKGASGQAVQNMNILFDLDETTGLL